jgi:hypothetical protein
MKIKLDIGTDGSAIDKLSEILSKVLGVFVKPTEKLLLAKTDLYIERLKKKNKFKLEKIDIVERAKLREFETSIRRQYNLEQISQYAIYFLDGTENPENIDLDWLHYFAASSQDVSEESIQLIFGKILSEEAKTQNSYSRTTLEILKNMNKNDIDILEKFLEICIFNENTGLVFNALIKDLLKIQNIDFYDIVHLENIGLVNYNESFIINFNQSVKLKYTLDNVEFYIKNDTSQTIKLAITLLAGSANELGRAISNIKKSSNMEIINIFKQSDKKKLLNISDIILKYLKSKEFTIEYDNEDDGASSFLRMIMD